MTQLIINIENKSILPHLKKILNALDGVSIAKNTSKPKGSLDKALKELKEGKIERFDSVNDLFQDLGI
ncbi:MAG: hypothetical protein K2K64_02790 [Muribaculaceae bacterium]|nr:hypothetical protein [Muribaculaceae bacterium]